MTKKKLVNTTYATALLVVACTLNLGELRADRQNPSENDAGHTAQSRGGEPAASGGTRGEKSDDGRTRGRGRGAPVGGVRNGGGGEGGTRTRVGRPDTDGAVRDSRPAADTRGNTPRNGVRSGAYAGRPGDQQTALPGGRREFRNARGQTIRTNTRGEVTNIEGNRRTGGRIAVDRGPRGERTVVTGRPGDRVVSYGPRRGFVERSVRPGYISRTYVGGGRRYAHVYREYRYRGVVYYRYVPAIYYGPRFYAWAINPWAVPVRYAWFGPARPAPWFGFYAGYFRPYPVYASPYLWLTDYLLAENLRAAYESQQAGNAGLAPPPSSNAQNEATLSPATRALIADEVRRQLAAEESAAQATSSNPNRVGAGTEQLPPALTQRFFVVSSNLDVTAAGQACSLTPGDIIQRKGKDVMPDGTVAVEVVSSKPGNCAADSATAIGVADLQEMHNQFREQLDSGLKVLADNQATGLPTAPSADARVVAEGTAVPAADAEAQVESQEADAVTLETQVR